MRFILLSATALFTLVACDPYPPTLKPDYTIKVVQTPDGAKAIPPECPNWTANNADPYDLQPMPQFGCATARNLALNIEQPNDLLQGRPMGPASGVTGVGSILRYNANQTRGLIDPNSAADSEVAATSASTASSPISGEASTSTSGSTSAALSPTSSAAGSSAPAAGAAQ